MHIDCFWVSGQLKGQGNGSILLDECIKDSKAKGKIGLTVLSSPKKMPFLSDPEFLKHKGFMVADSAEPHYDLLYLPFNENAEKPKFKNYVKTPHTEEKGFVLYYSNQCPFTAKYVPIIENLAHTNNIPFKTIHLKTTEQAQNAPAPFTAYTLFFEGKFVTNEILSEKKFLKIAEEKL